MTNAKYLWLDLETTGLHPIVHHEGILECATIVTTADLKILESRVSAFRFTVEKSGLRLAEPGRPPKDMYEIDLFVQDMHEKNGLWAECKKSHRTMMSEGEILCEIVSSYTWDEKKPVLAGSSVHFDHGFLRESRLESVQALYDKLHYRHYDVSVLKMFAKDNGLYVDHKDRGLHRAMPDIEDSLNYAKAYRKAVLERAG